MAKMEPIIVPVLTSPEGLCIFEIVRNYLQAHGYEGLYNLAGECSCEWSDLAPCDGMCGECLPGYRVPCDCGYHDFHIAAKKEAEDEGIS